MILVITSISNDRRVSGYDYENGRTFCWSEATFIKYYEQGCRFWQEMRVAKRSEIPSCAELSTITYDNGYGYFKFLIPADARQIYMARRKYILFRETNYGVHYFCKRGVESSCAGDAKIFDDSNVYKQLNYMKSHPMYCKQGWKCVPVNY